MEVNDMDIVEFVEKVCEFSLTKLTIALKKMGIFRRCYIKCCRTRMLVF